MNRMFSQMTPILKKAAISASFRSFSSNNLVKLHSITPVETNKSASLQTDSAKFDEFTQDCQNNKYEVRIE